MLKMVYRTFCLMFALTISKTASQNLTITSECITAGTRVTLKCETINFASAVLFYLNGVNKGGCTTFSCATTITGYEQPSQSGTSTEMAISAYDHSRDGGDWTCTYGASTSSPYTVELGNCNSPCDDDFKAYVVLIVCSYFPSIVKLLIILYLWYKRSKEVTYIRIIVTAQQKFVSVTHKINNGKDKDIPHSRSGEGFIYTIDVRTGELLQCVFQTDASLLTLSFKINDDVLYVRPGQNITLPTELDVRPQYSTITWGFNGLAFKDRGKFFKTRVTQDTYGVYDIKMTFETLRIVICIQNMKVQESKPVPCPIGIYRYWILMVLFVVIDIVVGVIGGSVTGYYRSTNGYCVEVIFIILMVLVPMIFFNCVEVALFLKLIKRSENKESSGSQDSAIAMLTTSTTSTVSPNAETTTSTTDGLSSSDVTATTSEGQNRQNWQPPK